MGLREVFWDLRDLIWYLRGLIFCLRGLSFGPERADFGEEETDGHTDGGTTGNSPLCLTESWPFGAAAQKEERKERKCM